MAGYHFTQWRLTSDQLLDTLSAVVKDIAYLAKDDKQLRQDYFVDFMQLLDGDPPDDPQNEEKLNIWTGKLEAYNALNKNSGLEFETLLFEDGDVSNNLSSFLVDFIASQSKEKPDNKDIGFIRDMLDFNESPLQRSESDLSTIEPSSPAELSTPSTPSSTSKVNYVLVGAANSILKEKAEIQEIVEREAVAKAEPQPQPEKESPLSTPKLDMNTGK